jgi:hypothetical protein
MGQKAIDNLKKRITKLLQDSKNPKQRSICYIFDKLMTMTKKTENDIDNFVNAIRELNDSSEIIKCKSNSRSGSIIGPGNIFFKYNEFYRPDKNFEPEPEPFTWWLERENINLKDALFVHRLNNNVIESTDSKVA